jgi:hypothetical protein
VSLVTEVLQTAVGADAGIHPRCCLEHGALWGYLYYLGLTDVGCPEIDVKVLQGYALRILNDNGYHGAVAHDVGSVAIDCYVVHRIDQDGYAFGIVLIVIADVEFPLDGSVGIEVVTAFFQYKDCAIACLLRGADGIQCLSQCGAHVGALIGNNAKLRSAVTEFTCLKGCVDYQRYQA